MVCLLDQFHINYEPRTDVKGQVQVDFIAEFKDNTNASDLKEKPPDLTRGKKDSERKTNVGPSTDQTDAVMTNANLLAIQASQNQTVEKRENQDDQS